MKRSFKVVKQVMKSKGIQENNKIKISMKNEKQEDVRIELCPEPQYNHEHSITLSYS